MRASTTLDWSRCSSLQSTSRARRSRPRTSPATRSRLRRWRTDPSWPTTSLRESFRRGPRETGRAGARGAGRADARHIPVRAHAEGHLCNPIHRHRGQPELRKPDLVPDSLRHGSVVAERELHRSIRLPDSELPGETSSPAAAPGHLCVYESFASNRNFVCIARAAPGYTCSASANRNDAVVVVGSAAAGTVLSVGTWPATAP